MFLPLDLVFPTAVAHSHVGIVSAEENLTALGDDLALPVDAGVDDGLLAAGADGLDLGDGVRHLKQTAAALKEMGQKIRPQAEAEHGHVTFVHDPPELIDLSGGEELALVGDDHVIVPTVAEQIVNIGFPGNSVGIGRQTDAGAHGIRAVADVQGGLDQPYPHAPLLVIELGDQRVCGFGGAHRSVFEVQLSHNGILSVGHL